ncbi:MAG: hypothetical protein BGO55_18540 [Sphingobacteriales bacterium 50-39]|nr:RNA polymerase sigma-70 factor [Sphingobacteriales bacterium]OJW55058.1 MAG: hypothetical protein BGO55_18540 [Sphingobacteriales bacterium 50-39]
MSAIAFYTDDMLLGLMSSDDEAAFSMIYRRYWQGLFVTAAKALRGREEAEDVVQDVFLSLWRRRRELKIEGSLAAYLQTSVRYKAIHYIEKNITRRDYLVMLANVAASTASMTAEMQLQLKEAQQTIWETVGKMPPRMQEVYHLSRHEHLTHREIAQRLDISEETVKKHIQHALQLIKTAISYNPAALSILIYCAVFSC